MAFLSTGSGGQTVSGGGGIAGSSGGVGSKKTTAAGSPGGWYNIQDFLAANVQDPAVKSRLEGRAQTELGTAAGEATRRMGAIKSAPTPTLYSESALGGLTSGGLTGAEQQSIRGYLGQNLADIESGTQSYEMTPEQQLQDIASPFAGMKRGDFGSIMGWYGNLEKPSAQYTPGMQRMDEMLLRGQKNFATEFPETYQTQFKEQVTDPMATKRAAIGAEQEKLTGTGPGSYQAAKQSWQTGIGNFLDTQQSKISDELARQQAQYQDYQGQGLQDILGQDLYSRVMEYPVRTATDKPTFDQPQLWNYNIEGINPWDYITGYGGATPSDWTAAQAALGPEQLNVYNALTGLVGDEGRQTYQGTPSDVYQTFGYDVDRAGLESQIANIEREMASQQAEQRRTNQPKIDDLQRRIRELEYQQSVTGMLGERDQTYLDRLTREYNQLTGQPY